MATKLKSLNKRDRQGVWLLAAAALYFSICGMKYYYYTMYGFGYGRMSRERMVLLAIGAFLLIGVGLYFHRYRKSEWQDVKEHKADSLQVELLGAIFGLSIWLWCMSVKGLYKSLLGDDWMILLCFVFILLPLCISALGCIVLFLRKILLERLKKDSLIWNLVEKLKPGRPLEKQAILEKIPLLIFATLGSAGVIWRGMYISGRYDVAGGIFISVFSAVLYIFFLINILNNRLNKDVDKLLVQIHEMASGNLDATPVEEKESLLYQGSQELQSVSGNLKNILEKHMQSERTKINLITNVSHDLKTPLTSMVGYIDLLKKEELSDTARDYIEVIAVKQEHLKNMIQDIFELSKSSSGDVQLELEELDMAKLLEQTLADMDDAIQENGMEIRRNEVSESLHFIGDGKKLYRVFQNLIGNALKYSLKGTRIYIETSKAQDKIKVEIKNTSSYEMNFTPEEVLERFTRGDESRNTEGHGLGLAIAESFTRNMGGDFNVKVDGDQFKVAVEFKAL